MLDADCVDLDLNPQQSDCVIDYARALWLTDKASFSAGDHAGELSKLGKRKQ